MNACKLHVEVIPDLAMCINTPLGSGSMITKIVKSVDVVIEDIHMPIDMLVLPMSDFEVVLGMNWLNHYRATIDCYGATLSFEIGNRQIKCELVNQRPRYMETMELWEKPMLAALLLKGKS